MPVPIYATNPQSSEDYYNPYTDPLNETPPPADTTPTTDPNAPKPLTIDELADALKQGKYNAGYLDWLQTQGLLPDSVRTAAQIQKDAYFARMNSRGGYGGIGNNNAWQQALAANPELNQIDWATWQQIMGMPYAAGYSPEQPTLNWNPGALPDQWRQAAHNQWRNWGFRPSGSLGAQGWTQYQRNPGQPYKPLDVNLFNAIPDENLRKWMLWMGGKSGLLQGAWEKPTW